MTPTTTGIAFRVTIVGPQHSEAYEGVRVSLDPTLGVAHLFGRDGATHYITVPLGCVLIEWNDPSPLQPQPRIPPYGAGAFDRLGEQVQRMADGIGRGLGRG